MIYRALNSTVEYLLFTLGFVVAVQLPEFIQQYKQYIAGKVSESAWHLDSYQKIADKSFGGDIEVLIAQYLKSDQLAIQQTGHFVADLSQRYQSLSQLLADLNSNSYFTQLTEFVRQMNVEDAQTVISYYQLAIPLTVEALSSGVVLAFLLIWLKIALFALLAKAVPITKSRRTI